MSIWKNRFNKFALMDWFIEKVNSLVWLLNLNLDFWIDWFSQVWILRFSFLVCLLEIRLTFIELPVESTETFASMCSGCSSIKIDVVENQTSNTYTFFLQVTKNKKHFFARPSLRMMGSFLCVDSNNTRRINFKGKIHCRTSAYERFNVFY